MVQVCLLNHVGLMYSGERRALELGEVLQGLPVALARKKGLLLKGLTYEILSQMQLSLTQRWQVWALDEERRRTGFGVFVGLKATPKLLHCLANTTCPAS
jgi:hypothetical protein